MLNHFIHSRSLLKPSVASRVALLTLWFALSQASLQPAWAKTHPVMLHEAPHSIRDQVARSLNDDLLKDAEAHHDSVVVLVGSAPLSTHKKDMALFVQLQSARLCGAAGCTTSVYLKKDNDWVTVIDSVNGNISVLPTRHQGYYDLLIGADDRWVWNGETYQDTAE